MDVEITPEIEEMVRAVFRLGNYDSGTHVLREALVLLQACDQLRHEINPGLTRLDRVNHVDAEEVVREVEDIATELLKATS